MQEGRAFLIKIQKIFSTGHHVVPVLFKAETKMTLKLCLYLVRMKHHLLKFSILLYVDCRFCHEKTPSTFSFVTMNKCFHVPFQTIKTGFWKKLGCTCVLLAIYKTNTITNIFFYHIQDDLWLWHTTHSRPVAHTAPKSTCLPKLLQQMCIMTVYLKLLCSCNKSQMDPAILCFHK